MLGAGNVVRPRGRITALKTLLFRDSRKKDRYKKQTLHNAMDVMIRGRRGRGRNPQLGASSLAQEKDLEGLATHTVILRPTPPLASQWMLARESGDPT